MKYKITGPETYEREIAGVKFDKGVAVTDNKWLAEWFSGRAGFCVSPVKPPGRAGAKPPAKE